MSSWLVLVQKSLWMIILGSIVHRTFLLVGTVAGFSQHTQYPKVLRKAIDKGTEKTMYKPIKENDHAMDDIRYFCSTVLRRHPDVSWKLGGLPDDEEI